MDRSEWVRVPRVPTEAMLASFNKCAAWLENTNDGSLYKAKAAMGGASGEPFYLAMIAAAPPPPAEQVITDPHHNGSVKWKWENGKLYQRTTSQSKWTECKRVHATPARIRTLANALPAKQASGEIPDAETLRLHMGELTSEEVLIAMAGYHLALSQRPVVDEAHVKVLRKLRNDVAGLAEDYPVACASLNETIAERDALDAVLAAIAGQQPTTGEG